MQVKTTARQTAQRRLDCKRVQDDLFRYLQIDLDIYDFSHYLFAWIKQDAPEGVDASVDIDYVDALTPDQVKAFKAWVKREGIVYDWLRHDPYNAPAYLTLHARKKMPKGSWLVHYTDNVFDEFSWGATLDSLALTGRPRERELVKRRRVDCSKRYYDTGLYGVQFGFAFDGDESYSTPRHGYKYGAHAVVFQSDCAVKAEHYGDYENQCIFPICTAYNGVWVSDPESPEIERADGRTLKFEDLDEVMAYVEKESHRPRPHRVTELRGLGDHVPLRYLPGMGPR